MNFAFCIGNGISRLKFDLTQLKEFGPTYGCNQLIETFDLDNTIVVDKTLLIDLVSRGHNKETNLYTRKRWKNLISADNLHFLDDPIQTPQEKWDNEIHWGSGTHAINLAAKNNADIVVMLGYDLHKKGVYNAQTVDPTCWIYQISKCFEMYPSTQFVQIQDKKWKCPKEWTSENFLRDDFKKIVQLLNDI